ncbi:inactive lysozyme 1A-like [Haematobia irritans]|uniref:inactive lysozyme 1A-like n=1 Tax=Haematobia irritans TaxID=7368 RepID=UPI003F4FC89E
MHFICNILIFTLISCSSGRILNRCSLAKEMYAMGVPKTELPHWVCIAKYESSFRTGVVGPTNANGSKDYGIFQINNKYWCHSKKNNRHSHNQCKVDCNDLLSDNIKKSVACARKIKAQQGWRAWMAWQKHCNQPLPNINDCFK